jgi:carbon-monoxide dehydrogenase large subunit
VICANLIRDHQLRHDNGQLLSRRSWITACRGRQIFLLAVASNEVLTRLTVGVKGAGEAGTAGAPPAVMNAINDALAPLASAISKCRRHLNGFGA